MIEKKIEDLIAALDRNSAAHSKVVGPVGISAAGPVDQLKKAAAKKPAKTEDQIIAEHLAKEAAKAKAEDAAEEAAQVAKDSGVTPEKVKAAVDSLLKANKRNEAVKLLASFEGAKSASGITEQGQEAMASFIEQAEEILLSA